LGQKFVDPVDEGVVRGLDANTDADRDAVARAAQRLPQRDVFDLRDEVPQRGLQPGESLSIQELARRPHRRAANDRRGVGE